MTLKPFIFLITVWNLSDFASGSNIDHLQFFLGCQAEIPCQREKSDSDSFKWLYKKAEHSEIIQIFFEDKRGVRYHNPFRRRVTVTQDRTIVINNFTEDDQGLYWCENCHGDDCKSEQPTVITVTREILSEIHKAVFVTAGSSFAFSCPGEFTNFKWTFDASYPAAPGNSAVRPETDFVTSNQSLHVVVVKKADAGKYTCWANTCNGHKWKKCTINLCVIAAHRSGKPSVSGAVIRDVEFSYIKLNSTSNNVTGMRTASVHANSHGSWNCSAKQTHNAFSTITSTNVSSNASVKTTGIDTQHKDLTPVIYGTLAAITCLILLPFFIFYFRPRLRADISDNPAGDGGGMVEEDFSLVYSSVVFRKHDKKSNGDENSSDCVYSEINV